MFLIVIAVKRNKKFSGVITQIKVSIDTITKRRQIMINVGVEL